MSGSSQPVEVIARALDLVAAMQSINIRGDRIAEVAIDALKDAGYAVVEVERYEPQAIFFEDSNCMEIALEDSPMVYHLIDRGADRVEVMTDTECSKIVGVKITGTKDIRAMLRTSQEG